MQWPKQLNSSLEEVDPEIADIIELEKARQWKVYIGFSVSSYSYVICFHRVSRKCKICNYT
jgi:hypothetical protein